MALSFKQADLLTRSSLHAFVSIGATFVSVATTRSMGINDCSADTNPSESNHTQGTYRPLFKWYADSMHSRHRSRKVEKMNEMKRLGRFPSQQIIEKQMMNEYELGARRAAKQPFKYKMSFRVQFCTS